MTDGFTDFEQIDAAREALRLKYVGLYKQTALGSTTEFYKDVQRQTLGEFGYRIGQERELPAKKVASIEALASKIGEDTFNRESGLMRDERINQLRGIPRVSVPLLSQTTLERIAANATSTVVAEARDSVIEEIVRRTGVENPRITVVRSAVLDRNTCGECNRLDGERYLYGSDTYYEDMPPNWCEGENMCRCVYIYEVPEDLRDGFDALVDGL